MLKIILTFDSQTVTIKTSKIRNHPSFCAMALPISVQAVVSAMGAQASSPAPGPSAPARHIDLVLYIHPARLR
jgi:hypothetical protein